MTRATAKPLKRLVSGRTDGALVVELTAEECRLRPFRTRRGGESEVVLCWQTIYRNGLLIRYLERKRR